jgi:hypothetical protein
MDCVTPNVRYETIHEHGAARVNNLHEHGAQRVNNLHEHGAQGVNNLHEHGAQRVNNLHAYLGQLQHLGIFHPVAQLFTLFTAVHVISLELVLTEESCQAVV